MLSAIVEIRSDTITLLCQ